MTRFRPVLTCLILSVLAVTPAPGQQRVVGVVYDDSGSMGNPQNVDGAWRYANYALQMLTGLLAPSDELTVVLMSAPAQAVRIDLQRRAEQIAAIHQGYRAAGQTPYAAVQRAMRELTDRAADEAAAGADPSDKWLIVITDGDFQVEPSTAQTLREDVRAFVEATGARVIFLLIGEVEPAVAAVWEDEVQAGRSEARTRGEIVARMQEIAADVTARSPETLPVQLGDAALIVDAEFPLRRLTVLQQRTALADAIPVAAARGANGELLVEPPLTPLMPTGSSNPIAGHITHIREPGADAAIPAGAVTLSMQGAIDPAQLHLLPEVAARLDVTLTDAAGRALPGAGPVFQICSGDTAIVRATLLSPQGDTVVEQVRRPDRFDVRVRYGEDIRALSPGSDQTFETALSAAEGSEPISVSAAYPGYFNFRSPVFTLRGIECPPRTLGLSHAPWSALVTELDRAAPLLLLPTADGGPVPLGELDGWTIERVDEGRLRAELARTADGWSLAPRSRWGFACCTPTGLIPLEFELRSGSARDPPARALVQIEIVDVSVWAKCGALLLTVLLAILGATWLIGALRKRRFCRGSEILYQRVSGTSTGRGHTQGLPGGFVSRYLVPYLPERSAVNGLTFEAGTNCSHVLIPTKIQSAEMYVAGMRLDDPGRRPVQLPAGETVEIRRGRNREVYRYDVYRSS